MTFADETANALYATVCERPECDTARLILADRLDEVGDRDLAEFIRVQVEMAQFASLRDGDLSKSKAYARYVAASDRLLAAHPEWRKCPCPACGGFSVAVETCPTCGGTGDLFASRWIGAKERTRLEYRTVTLSRGFPASVECAAADVWREEREESRNMDGDGWATRTVPTEWAKAVVRATPVRIFTVGDLEPWDFGGTDRQRGWWREGGAQVRNHATIHGPIYDLIAPEMMLFGAKAFRTEAAARSALGLATGLWVRAAAYPAVPVG